MVTEIPLEAVKAGDNDRKQFARQPLEDLARSIAAQGLAQPITVRPVENGHGRQYEIVAGERRFRAHQIYTEKVQAGEWPVSPHVTPGTVAAIVRELSDEQAAAIMLVENTSREDLNPKEEALAYAARRDGYDWSLERIAEVGGKSVETVKSRLALLNLADDILEAVASGTIPLAYAGLMTDLDENRQRLAMQLLVAGPIALTNFRRYVMQLQEEQAQDSMFDLTTLWVEQVAEMADGPKNGKAALSRLDLPEDPDLPECDFKYSTPIGDVMFGYIQELLDDGRSSEAAAVGQVYANLVRIKKACLPKLTMAR